VLAFVAQHVVHALQLENDPVNFFGETLATRRISAFRF
jgi:hypothetical protein